MSKNIKKILKDLSIGSVFGILFVFIMIVFIMQNTYSIRTGIKIKVDGIENGESFNSPSVKITGNAKHATKVTVSGKIVPVDTQGNFETTMLLMQGTNVVKFEAEDNFNNKDELTYVVYSRDKVEISS